MARKALIVLACVVVVLGFATVQLRVGLGVVPAPQHYIVPVLLGSLFGVLLAIVIELRQRIAEQAGVLAGRVEISGQELAQARDQLLQAGRQQTLGLVAAGVAHDINNVLSIILANREFLGETPLTNEQREFVDAIGEATGRAIGIARRLQHLARGTSSTAPPSTDLASALVGIESLLRRAMPPSLTLKVQVSSSGLPVPLTPTDIDQLLLNLAINARDASTGEGQVVIEAREEGDQIVLVVADSGAGIADEDLPHLFTPFFTTKGARGSGLGLAVVKDIVERGRGEITVASSRGQGTTFSVRLPRAA